MADEHKLETKFTANTKDFDIAIENIKIKIASLKSEFQNFSTGSNLNNGLEKVKKTFSGAKSGITSAKKEVGKLGQSVQNIKPLKLTSKESLKSMKLPASKGKEGGKSKPEMPKFDIGDVVVGLGIAKASEAIYNLGKTSVTTFANLSTQLQNLERTFGTSTDNIKTYIEGPGQALGLANSEMVNYANMYGRTLKSITGDTQEASEMTKKYLETTAIISAKSGYDIETVGEAIKSGLMGETESIDKLGIEVKAKVLETTDAFKQLAKGRSWEKLGFKEQQQVIMLGILEQASKTYGTTLEKTGISKLNDLTASLKNARDNMLSLLGEGLAPITGILGEVAKLIEYLSVTFKGLDPSTKTLITGLFLISAVALITLSGIDLLTKGLGILSGGLNIVSKMTGISSDSLLKFGGITIVILGTLIILSSAFGGLGNVVRNIGGVITSTFYYIAGNIGKAVGNILSVLSMLIPGLRGPAEAVKAWGDSLINSASGIANKIKGSSQSVATNAKGLSNGLLNSAKGAGNANKAMDKATEANDKNAKSAKKAGDANKKLAENLQGFDEINKLQADDTSTGVSGDVGGGGGPAPEMPSVGGAGALPSLDTGSLTSGMDVLNDKFADIKKAIEDLMPYIITFATIWGIIKVVNTIKELSFLGDVFGKLGGLIARADIPGKLGSAFSKAGSLIAKADIPGKISGAFSKLTAVISTMGMPIAGVILIIAGLAVAIKGLMDYLKNPTWESFGVLLAGLGIIVAGVGIAFFAAFGWIPLVVAAVVAAIVAIGVAIYANWDAICQFLAGVGDWIMQNVVNPAIGLFNTCFEVIKTIIFTYIAIYTGIILTIVNFIWNMVLQPIINFFKACWELIKTIVLTYINIYTTIILTIVNFIWNMVLQPILNFFKACWEGIKVVWDAGVKLVSEIILAIVSWINANIIQPLINFFKNLWRDISAVFSVVVSFFKDVFSRAWEGIKGVFSGVSSFFSGIWNSITGIFRNIGTSVANAVGNTFKSSVNGIIGFAEGTINGFIKNINTMSGIINKIPGVHIGVIPELRIPRMATGGVVGKRPGGIIANLGEGRYNEAVVPLGNSPQFRSMKEEIASSVSEVLLPLLENESERNANNSPVRGEIELTAGGYHLGKVLLDLVREAEEVE